MRLIDADKLYEYLDDVKYICRSRRYFGYHKRANRSKSDYYSRQCDKRRCNDEGF